VIYTHEEMEEWAGVIERRFVAAVKTEAEWLAGAKAARAQAIMWLMSDDTAPGSFRWVCDLLGMEPDAVRRERRAIMREPDPVVPAYPNLEALAEGRVSGAISEWPSLPAEARDILARVKGVK
jgi:hypothetical protein